MVVEVVMVGALKVLKNETIWKLWQVWILDFGLLEFGIYIL
jgi:hypothetical protein